MVTVVGSGNRRTGTTGYEGEDEEEDPDPERGGGGGGGGGPFTAAVSQTTTSVRLSTRPPPPNRRRKRPQSGDGGGGVTFADLYMDMMDELRPNPAMVRFRLREVFAGDGDLERGEEEEKRQLVFLKKRFE